MPLRVLAGVALATAVVAVAGIVLGFRPYPFTDAVVAAFCITAGTSIGRAVPPRRRPMAALLAVLAALDTVQVFAAGPHADGPSAMRLWTMFLLVTPLGSSAIGFGDLAVVAAIGELWDARTHAAAKLGVREYSRSNPPSLARHLIAPVLTARNWPFGGWSRSPRCGRALL